MATAGAGESNSTPEVNDPGSTSTPPRYRPPTGKPGHARGSSRSPDGTEQGSASPARSQGATIDVRVIFQRGGYCAVSLLPSRRLGMPDELLVSSEGQDVQLRALQDEWYQDVTPNNLGELLRAGIVWSGSGADQRWVLSGREVFVLAHSTTHRGFVSCPRLALGRSHVVLCMETQLGRVEQALRLAGCADWTQLGEDDGAPSGWRVLRDTVPRNPVVPTTDADILNVLRPLPEIEVALEGGIRLARNTWLRGYPPAVRIYGDPDHTETVLIDDQKADAIELGMYRAPGWDKEGKHRVWCNGTSMGYSIVRSETKWTYWPAYSLATNGSRARRQKFEFCGPLVRPVTTREGPDQQDVVHVPGTNPVLLGACPGEVFVANPRSDLRGARCLGLPPFNTVWALPPQPLRCDKRVDKVLLVGEPEAESNRPGHDDVGDRRALRLWCVSILDASRKRLAVEPRSQATYDLWREYQQFARVLWKRLR